MRPRGSPNRTLEIALLTFTSVTARTEEPAAGDGGVEAPPPIDIGAPIEGRLEATDPRLPGKGPYRVFRFIPTKSGKVTIRMESPELDAYVLVRDGGGNTLAEDDNSGRGDGAQAVFEAEGGRQCDVLAGARFDKAAGKFRLEVESGQPEKLTYGQELVRDLAWYEDAERSTTSLPRRGTVLDAIGRCRHQLGAIVDAKKAWEASLEIARDLSNPQAEASILGNIGIVHSQLGDHRAAIDCYDTAIKICRDIADSKSESIVLVKMGNAYSRLGQQEKAFEYYEQALEIYREIGDRLGEGIVTMNMGGAACELGSQARAVECNESALRVFRQFKDLRGEYMVLVNLGSIYVEIGLIDKGIQYYKEALQIIRQGKDRRNEGIVLGNLGAAYNTLGQPQLAMEHFAQALEVQRETGNLGSQAFALCNLGNSEMKLERPEKAIELYNEALSILGKIKVEGGATGIEGSICGNLGVAYADLGQRSVAVEHYDRARDIFRRIGSRREEAWVLWNLGKMNVAREVTGLALEAFRSAHAIEKGILTDVERGLDESASRSLASQVLRRGAVDYFKLLVKLVRATGSSGERQALLQEALDLVEGFRSRTLLSALQTGDALRLLSPEGKETWKRLRTLREGLSDLMRRTFEALPDDVEKRKEALGELERESLLREDEIGVLERRLKTGEPKYASLFAGERKWTPEELQGLLAANEVLLHFNVIDEKIAVFVGRRGKGLDLHLLNIGAGDLRAKVDAVLADMKPRDGKLTSVSDLKAKLGGLRAELLRGLEDKLEGARSILVVPDGFLHLFPFEALVLEDGSYLVEKFGLRYAPSLGVLLELGRREEAAAKARLVLLGDPDFGKSPAEEEAPAIALRIRGGENFRRLEHAREEIDRIAVLFEEKTILRGKEATESRFKKESPRATLLHVVTHGRYEQVGEGNALFYSGLAFAGLNRGGDGKEDGFLTAAEVMALDLRAVDLAVLSACDTAAGALQAHEGKFGLERAFFVAGVKAFIGSLWRVDDRATTEFMGRFYGYLLEGKPRGEALRLTKVEFIRGNREAVAPSGTRGERGIGLTPKAGGDWSHPYYWAPFVLSGDGRGTLRGR